MVQKLLATSIENVLTTYSPSIQLNLTLDEALFGSHPCLCDLKAAYGTNAPTIWLIPQLLNLSEYCGCKEKMESSILEETAVIIAREYYYLKISELAYFFYRFKTGAYGKFYGAIDPLLILIALRNFVRERNWEIERKEQEQRRLQREEQAKNAVPYTEYLKLKAKKLCN